MNSLHAPALSVAEWLAKAERLLVESGVGETRANAEFLLAAALDCGRARLSAEPGRTVSPNRGRQFWKLVRARSRRMPLAYVLGSQPFLGFDIKVTPAVLIPRPETEGLVEAVAALARRSLPASPHIVEIGTGSGCVAVALAKLLAQAVVYATDISAEALRIAEANARAHGVVSRIRFLREDLFKPGAGAAGWADLIVSNPPYVPTAEIAQLEEELRREPVLALDGGRDGLAAIRAVAADAPRLLKRGGWLGLEFGFGQAASVRGILGGSAFAQVEILRDLQGQERYALGRLDSK